MAKINLLVLFGGESTEHSVSNISAYNILSAIDEKKYKCLIEVDGGINAETGIKCVEAGADALVSGNYIFSSDNPKNAIDSIRGNKI